MWNDYLSKIGLSNDQAKVYSSLLELGSITARKVALKTGLKRALTYKILDQLIALGLAEKNDKLAKIALFSAAHPSKLKEYAEKKRSEMENAEKDLGNVLGDMASAFNLASGKPNVQFFEGLEGVIKAGSDSLESATEIYEYIDNEAVAKNIPEFNSDYVKRRSKGHIKKKMIAVDSPFNRERAKKFDPEITEVRFLPSSQFATVMQIYDDKVSYITLNRDRMIGAIIESKEIYAMHKALFESQWEKASR